MNYTKLNEMLTGRNANRRKLSNNTYAERRSEAIAVRLHATDILTFKANGDVVLNTGGWKTHTTKDRLNYYGPTGLRIHQERGKWKVHYSGHAAEFADNMVLRADGNIEGGKSQSEADKEKALQKRIAQYCKTVAAALPVPLPGNGDCFFCAMREVETHNPLGECTKDTSHLESHFDEGYVVPSLVYRALEFAGCNPNGGGCAWFWYAFKPANGEKSLALDDSSRQTIARFVRKYLRRQFGLA